MRRLYLGLVPLVLACGTDPAGPIGKESKDPAPVASVTIDPVTGPLSVGSTLRLKVILRDAAGSNLEASSRVISFTSSDGRVLSVDGTGLVRALAEGEARVTVTSEGKSAQISISVTAAGDACGGCWDYSAIP